VVKGGKGGGDAVALPVAKRIGENAAVTVFVVSLLDLSVSKVVVTLIEWLTVGLKPTENDVGSSVVVSMGVEMLKTGREIVELLQVTAGAVCEASNCVLSGLITNPLGKIAPLGTLVDTALFSIGVVVQLLYPEANSWGT
jgi:hypothetical protein